VLGCFAVRDLAQEKPDSASIRTLESKWVDAYKQRQIADVAALLAEDYVITLEDGTTYGKVGFISYNAGPCAWISPTWRTLRFTYTKT
jgi:ketosteroid isomerase-like protein